MEALPSPPALRVCASESIRISVVLARHASAERLAGCEWPRNGQGMGKTRACTDDAPLDAHHAVRVAALARQRVVLHVQGVVILVLDGTRVVNLNRCVMK